jgi:uncharacterized SAM-dependent methyltransferase
MQVNDLIFKELIKRGYSLQGKTRVWNIADSKLWYVTPEQAQGFLDLEQEKEYQKEIIQKEINLIKDNLDSLLKSFAKKPVNIIDLGCGDGKKAVIFIDHLKSKTNIKLRYCPVDISGYMVEKAIKNIKRLNVGEVVEFQWNISDFENLENIASVLRSGDYKTNLFLLLGNTLGNFEINELLYAVRSSMKDGDFLLIGNGLDNRQYKDLLKSYGSPRVRSWLVRILKEIGFKDDELDFHTKFDHSRVELYFVVKQDKKVSFQDKTIYFNKGDQILVAVSYKYSKDEFKEYMKMYFDDLKVFVSDDDSYGLALCKK